MREDGKRPDGVTLAPMEIRLLVGVGCHMTRHFRPVIQVACNIGGREGSSCGRGEKGVLAIHTLVLTSFH